MEKSTLTTMLGDIEGYAVGGMQIIPSSFVSPFDAKQLARIQDFATHTMSNGMKAQDYYKDLIVDAEEYMITSHSRGELNLTASERLPIAEVGELNLNVAKGKVNYIAASFYDVDGNLIDTGTGTLDVVGVNLTGYESEVGSIDTASPSTQLEPDTALVKITATPNTVVGIDSYRLIVCQGDTVFL